MPAIAHRSSDSVFSYLTGMRTSWDGRQNSSTSLRGYEFELSHLGTMQGRISNAGFSTFGYRETLTVLGGFKKI